MIGNKILRTGLLVVCLCLSPTLRAAKVWRGDANGDGKLSMKDLTTMIRLLGSGQSTATLLKATPALDVDKDGAFSITDVRALVQVLLGKADAESLNVGGGFSDDDQNSPGSDGTTSGGFSDSDQDSPGTQGSGGGFKDDDMTDPT